MNPNPKLLPVGYTFESKDGKSKLKIIETIKDGQGGFAITYKGVLSTLRANDVWDEQFVAIKEFFMEQENITSCNRDSDGIVIFHENPACEGIIERFLEKFKQEVKILSNLNEENIIKVKKFGTDSYFEFNNTAYYVMEFIDGGKLSRWINSRGVYRDFQSAWNFLRPLCRALAKVHQNHIYHLDLSPNNILIKNKEGKIIPIIIDFGASKVSNRDKSLLSGVAPTSSGYAAPELYSKDDIEVGAFTDIYSLGAIFYFIMRGTNPPIFDENFTVMDINPASIDKNLFLIMQKTMNYKKADRFQTVDELIKECDRLSGYKEPEPKNISGKTGLRDNNASGKTKVRSEGTKDNSVTPENQNKEEKKEAIGGVVDILIINSEKKENQKKEKEVPKIGPNDLCPCGTGLKFKNCHGKHLFEEPIPPTPRPKPQPKPIPQPKPTLQPEESWLKKNGKWLVLLFVGVIALAGATSYFMNNSVETEEPVVVPLSPEELAIKQLQEQITAVQNGEMSASELISQFTKDAYFVIIEDGGVEVGSIADPSHQIMHLLTTDSRIDMVRDYQVKKIYRDNGDNTITSIDIEEIK